MEQFILVVVCLLAGLATLTVRMKLLETKKKNANQLLYVTVVSDFLKNFLVFRLDKKKKKLENRFYFQTANDARAQCAYKSANRTSDSPAPEPRRSDNARPPPSPSDIVVQLAVLGFEPKTASPEILGELLPILSNDTSLLANIPPTISAGFLASLAKHPSWLNGVSTPVIRKFGQAVKTSLPLLYDRLPSYARARLSWMAGDYRGGPEVLPRRRGIPSAVTAVPVLAKTATPAVVSPPQDAFASASSSSSVQPAQLQTEVTPPPANATTVPTTTSTVVSTTNAATPAAEERATKTTCSTIPSEQAKNLMNLFTASYATGLLAVSTTPPPFPKLFNKAE